MKGGRVKPNFGNAHILEAPHSAVSPQRSLGVIGVLVKTPKELLSVKISILFSIFGLHRMKKFYEDILTGLFRVSLNKDFFGYL